MSLTARAARTAAIAMTCTAALLPGTALAAAAGPGSPVPSAFKANSVTWLSAQRGWVLGAAASCGSKCSDVIGTTDGAKTWHLIGKVPLPIVRLGKARPGVSEVRFATPQVGWAFAPELARTTNGGKTWTRMPIPGGGKQVLDLATSSSEIYAVISDCAWGTGACARPLSLWRIAARPGSKWARITLNLPRNFAADVAVFGKTVYVIDQQLEFGRPDKFYASTDGVHFAARPVPCAHSQDLALIQAVPMSATRVALLCDGDPGFSKAVKTVYVSSNTGKTDTYAGQMGVFGIQAQLAASPSGNLAVASASNGSFIYVNDSHKKKWTMVEGISDGGAGWNDITYVSNTTAWVVYAPADFSGIGQLWVTRDSGQHWSVVSL